MNPIDPHPAHRQDARSLAQLFGEAKAADHEVELGGRMLLEAARRAGAALLAAKEQVPHGEWMATVEKHMPGRARTARAYMRVAEHWGQVQSAASIRQALSWLSREEDGDDPGQWQHAATGQGDLFPEDEQATTKEPLKPAGDFTQEQDGWQHAATPEPPAGDRSAEHLEAALRGLLKVREWLSLAFMGRGKDALSTTLSGREPRLRFYVDGASFEAPESSGTTGRVNRVSNPALEDLFRVIGAAKAKLRAET